MKTEAVVLLSGGVDSATTLAIARAEGFACRAITFDYGQRHRVEVQAAERVAKSLGVVEHVFFNLDLRQFGGSSLTGSANIPQDRAPSAMSGIPTTYVPGRNIVFLSIASALAEARSIRHIFLGANAMDYSGYPDCRPEFMRSMEGTLLLGMKCGIDGSGIQLITPLISLRKEHIICRGKELGVDFSLTVSCYSPDPAAIACGRCDACILRRRGFELAGLKDPTRYSYSCLDASDDAA
jgi:7-cyano-7-deazaguanine synthase